LFGILNVPLGVVNTLLSVPALPVDPQVTVELVGVLEQVEDFTCAWRNRCCLELCAEFLVQRRREFSHGLCLVLHPARTVADLRQLRWLLLVDGGAGGDEAGRGVSPGLDLSTNFAEPLKCVSASLHHAADRSLAIQPA